MVLFAISAGPLRGVGGIFYCGHSCPSVLENQNMIFLLTKCYLQFPWTLFEVLMLAEYLIFWNCVPNFLLFCFFFHLCLLILLLVRFSILSPFLFSSFSEVMFSISRMIFFSASVLIYLQKMYKLCVSDLSLL